ncbi:uncharacterized protein METZ01_LOCUS228626 [marine metagenome]|uniref:tRNA/rRNA methyltransferase SpoU type domain-containing protein n=1 Tax=marine metagenome TaxID=408172 RepID=A0A382GLK7_9ZZZZ|tara:strand:- start:1886 stop:2365 length:480 start_codon:yes stop_codon:yes gene_type:complete
MTQSAKSINNHLKIALYQPDIPQNTAAIIRLCACFNTRLDIIQPCGFVMDDKRFKRVCMDYINNCEIKSHKSFQEFINNKKSERIILMTTKAKTHYHKFKFSSNDTILFGRESKGVPEKIHQIVDQKLIIPIQKNTRSLNIVSSVAITLSEALRQTSNL